MIGGLAVPDLHPPIGICGDLLAAREDEARLGARATLPDRAAFVDDGVHRAIGFEVGEFEVKRVVRLIVAYLDIDQFPVLLEGVFGEVVSRGVS